MILSYVVAATAALLSALCYAEMAVSLPIAGGAFNYISISFGELAAWLVAWNMCLETTLSSAAVARGFASYLATLVGLQPSALRLAAGPIQFDPAAALLILLLTALLIKGTRESSIFNMGASAASSRVSKLPAEQPCSCPPKPAHSLPDAPAQLLPACLPACLPARLPPPCLLCSGGCPQRCLHPICPLRRIPPGAARQPGALCSLRCSGRLLCCRGRVF